LRGKGEEMSRRIWFLVVAAAFALATGTAVAVASSDTPSGERIVGGHGAHGGTVVEPVYDDITGAIRYVSTPRGAPDPVRSNPVASAPFYLPVYPAGTDPGTLLCSHQPENCPDHGPALAFLATFYDSAVYGMDPATVLGHDHLMAGPASHGDFNVAWVPTLVLFTDKGCADQNLPPTCNVQHITLESQVDAMADAGTVTEIPLDGSEPAFPGGPNGELVSPDLTFLCAVVSASVYARGVPFTG
jgi:hypothetical protein